jgi:DNA-binding transcriptional regulator PaaX
MVGWKDVLGALSGLRGGVSVHDLASRMGLSASQEGSLRVMLRRCLTHGTITRTKEGRQHLYELTSYGKRRVANKFKPLKRN